MLTLTIITVISIAIANLIIKYSIKKPFADDYFFANIIGFIVGLIISAIAVTLFIKPVYKSTVIKTIELESFVDNTQLNGNFFIGSGNINETFKYTFYYKTNDGIKLSSISTKNTTIKYTTGTPIIETIITENVNKWTSKAKLTKYIVYIPKGTILNTYTLDAN